MADNINGSLTFSLERERMAMTNMSRSLLEALWIYHPDKLKAAMAQGRKVKEQ